MALLVDSSVWIAAARPHTKELLQLSQLIQKNELIYTLKIIQVEVCQGAKSEFIFHHLWDSFLGFEFLEITDFHWAKTAWNYFKCRKKGITVSTIDCLIATAAKEYDIPLWSLDKDYQKMRAIIGFETTTP